MNSKIRKIIFNIVLVVGWGAVILYSLWWIATAAGVVSVIVMLLNSVWYGFSKASGWKQIYLFGGMVTVAITLVRFGPNVVKEFLKALVKDPMEAVIAIVVLGCIPILAIPLIVTAWPFVWWLTWNGRKSLKP